MRHPSRLRSAFTLIELMIVLGLIGILTVIAISTSVGNRPRTRLVAATSEIRLELLRVRTGAVRSDANHKVCFYKDDDATDLVPKGRMVVFKCGTNGIASCAGTTICDNNPAASGVQWTASAEDCATATKWCLQSEVDLGVLPRSNEHVSINRFLNASLSDSGRNSVELTYLPTGMIDNSRSTGTSMHVELTNYDQCLPSTASCSNFSNRLRVNYNAGGGARIVE